MSVLDTRLSKLMPALNAQERAVLVLQTLKYGTPEDPAWRSTMPRSQSAAFNHFIGLMNACNIYVAHMIVLEADRVSELEVFMSWLTSLWIWQDQLLELTQYAEKLAGKPLRRLGKEHAQLVASLRYGPLEKEDDRGLPDGLAQKMTQRLRYQVPVRWAMLRAIEITVGEVSEELGGEDPLKPRLREHINESKAILQQIARTLSVEGVPVPEFVDPPEEVLVEARDFIRRGERLSV